MDLPTALRFFLPKVPFVLKSAVYHSLWLSPTSSIWTLKTELTIQILRSLCSSKPTPISKQQRSSLRDFGIKEPTWISKVTLPPPAEAQELLDLLVSAVDALKEGSERYEIPSISPVEAEWTGYRPKAHAKQPRPDLSEAQHYAKLMSDTTSDETILYFHGGAYYLCDPSSHRVLTTRLAQFTGGRCLSVRYRLAPQAAFPAQLLDALVAYISLIYPPPGSLHAPVPASKIVIAGDSAGGGISLGLLQLLLQINRSYSSPFFKFHSTTVHLPLPMPAGVAVCSPWLDLTRSLPSIKANMQYDYLPPQITPQALTRFPKDSVWPTDPPRGDLYCDTSMLCHPLVSPVVARNWEGACPVWMGVGEEMLVDECKVLASRMAKQGVQVQFDMWEAMPHCFAFVLQYCGLEASRNFFKRWVEFSKRVTGNGNGHVVTKGIWHEVKTDKEKEMKVEELAPLSDEEVLKTMRQAQEARREGFEGEAKLMPML